MRRLLFALPLLLAGCLTVVGPDPGPSPDGMAKVADASEAAGETYLRMLADEHEKVAATPPGDEISYGRSLNADSKAARLAAFKPVNELGKELLSGTDKDAAGKETPRYSPEKAAAFSRAVASGLRRAAQ
jgi:hypothetical protein